MAPVASVRGLLLATAALLGGCGAPSVEETRARLTSDDYVQTEEASKHVLTLRYVPKALRLINGANLVGERPVTPGLLDTLAAENPVQGHLFMLNLAPSGTSDTVRLANDVLYGTISGHGDYIATQREYLTGLQEKIWLEVAGRKLALASYQMENTHGMTRDRNFLLLFPDLPEALGEGKVRVHVVLDDIVPGLARRKIAWRIPVSSHAH